MYIFLPLFISFFLMIFTFWGVFNGLSLLNAGVSQALDWGITLGPSLEFEILLLMDFISYFFLASVALIAAAVFLFSRSYISGEKFFIRFHLLVFAFVISIWLLILSPNLIRIMLGWDGLGVTSFLLVIYFQRPKSSNAGMLTVLSNRVGDLLLILAIGLCAQGGSWSIFNCRIDGLFLSVPYLSIILVWASFTKRAQIPFSAWLPAAMAAPTPVSSLVHSSTLVTAGVYLLIRLTSRLRESGVLFWVLFFGVLTILIAGFRALLEPDIKKIVALSTLSQLGLIIRAIGLGLWKGAFLHLLIHAYFKAMLFISVGNIIHLSDDFQDIRKASLSPIRRITIRFSGVANMSLCGLPFIAGFFRKDLVLEYGVRGRINFFFLFLFYFSTALTAAYSVRFTILCWLRGSRKTPITWEQDFDYLIYLCCGILWPLAIIAGPILMGFNYLNLTLPISLIRKNLTISVIFLGEF